jgi:hypothetical protein
MKTELSKGWVEDLARRETEERSRKGREDIFSARKQARGISEHIRYSL